MKKEGLILPDGKIHMWTVQSEAVLQQIKKDGFSVVKKEYINKKYGESSWIFNEAYSFFRSASEAMGFFSSMGAESPMWFFGSAQWLFGEKGSYVIEAACSPERFLLFDREKWQKVLNLSYIGETPSEEKIFSEKLSRAGLQSGYEAFSEPFYPMFKSEIKNSWKRLFDVESTSRENIRAALWVLYEEDIVKAVRTE